MKIALQRFQIGGDEMIILENGAMCLTVMIPWVVFGDFKEDQKQFVVNRTTGVMRYLVNEGFISNLQNNPVNLVVTTRTKRR